MQGRPMNRYSVDVKAFFTVIVEAQDEDAAREYVTEHIDGNEANFGAWPDGTPITATVGLDGEHDVEEVEP